MNSDLLLGACFFAFGGVVFLRYPDTLYALKHQQTSANAKLSSAGRRQFEFASALWFLFALGFLVLAFAD